MQLTKEEIGALNRLLAWRARATVGRKVRAEIQHDGSEWYVGVCVYEPDDSTKISRLFLAYRPLLSTAADAVLDELERESGVEDEHDTEPHNQKPSAPPAALTPIEELIA